jgi:putative SOS response-associated peptidase YedK
MCSNYEPVTLNDRFMAHFGVVRPDDVEPPESAFPGLNAFFLRREDQAALAIAQVQVGFFGMLPPWAPDVAFGRKTYNCKSETMRQRPAFKEAWFAGNRCAIPIERAFEWCYETGEAVRWSFKRSNGDPLIAAGLWGVWIGPQGEEILSFTMLTTNADGHPWYSRMHAAGEERAFQRPARIGGGRDGANTASSHSNRGWLIGAGEGGMRWPRQYAKAWLPTSRAVAIPLQAD